MKSKSVILHALLICSAAAPAQPALREPTAKWTVDFADAQCVATRAYGTDNEPLYLFLKAPPIGNVMQIGVMRKGDPVSARQYKATIEIDGRSPVDTSVLVFRPQDSLIRNYVINSIGRLHSNP